MSLIPAVEIIPGVLELTDLALDLVKVLTHLAGVGIVSSRYLMHALFKLLLGMGMLKAFVLHVLQFPLDHLVLRSLS